MYVSQQVTSEKLLWKLWCMIFLRVEIDAIIGGIIFMGLLITFYIQWERKRLFEATVE